jgi:hypothetical protein
VRDGVVLMIGRYDYFAVSLTVKRLSEQFHVDTSE